MWAHVEHEVGLARCEKWWFLITQCVWCVLRPEIVACTQDVNWLTWSHQTLLRNWVVIKVVFGFAKKHAVRHGQSRWDLPLSTWERYFWATRVSQIKKCTAMPRLSVNQGSESRHREREVNLEQDQISWGKRNNMYMTLWRLVWYDLYVCIGVDMSC